MKNNTIMTTEKAALFCGGELHGINAEITGFAIDSRAVKPGDLFIALRGENTDGHKYIKNAIEAGAVCVLSEKACDECCIVVNDTLKALQKLGAEYLKTVDPKVFAVTGSVGKTTTKQFISSVISASFKTQKTEGNYNSVIGMPLTLLGVKPDCEALVLEMGMSARGEIKTMSDLAKPSVAVITNIGSSHLEMLGSRENILCAKLEIISGLRKGGTLIMNGDDRLLWREKERLKHSCNVIYYALANPDADYRADNISFSDGFLKFDLHTPQKTVRNITAPTVGMHNVYNAAAAYICGELAGIEEEKIKEGIASFSNTGMRQKIYSVNGYTIICDCYNASPESMKASFAVLTQTAAKEGKRPVAVLGEMRELGAASNALHRQTGAAAYESGVKLLITNHTPAQPISTGALEAGMEPENICRIPDGFDEKASAELIKSLCKPGDVILFKASRAVELEKVISAFEELIK